MEYWYASFILLGLWLLIGYIVVRVFQERKKRREEERRKKEKFLRAMQSEDAESLEDLEKLYGKKG